jgi:hypothetical protein
MKSLVRSLFHKPAYLAFRARSSARDEQSDAAKVRSIADSIERSLKATEAEHAGLSGRMEDTRLRASMVVGNETYGYLSREKQETTSLHLFEGELQNGHERLNVLQQSIAHLKFLKAALFSRFPDSAQHDEVGPH